MAVVSTGADPALTDWAKLWRTYGAPEAICARTSILEFGDPALTDRANLWRTYGAPEAICTRISY